MKILFINSLMFHNRTWGRVREKLSPDGIDLCFVDQASAPGFLDGEDGQDIDLLMVELALGMPGVDQILKKGRAVSRRIGLSPEIPADFTTFSPDNAARFKQYLTAVSEDNYVNGVRFLAACAGMEIPFDPPAEVATTGLYHPKAAGAFESADDYQAWISGRIKNTDVPRIGLVFYYSQLVEQNTEDVDAVILALESHGLCPVCVFCQGAEDPAASGPNGPAWLDFFRQPPGVEVVLSFLGGRLLKTFDQIHLLELLDAPVIQLLRSHGQTPEQWQKNPRGLPGMTAVYSLSQPETFGVVAPVMVAGTRPPQPGEPAHMWRSFVPIPDRIHTLCRRAKRWAGLRRTANQDKRVTFVLHNNPCKGVEATVGLAAGLDAFESLAKVVQEMKAAGYDVGEAPAKGEKILEALMSRKAASEFRWTTVEEIVSKGGALYMMDADEYLPWFASLPETARKKVTEDWEDFPGQGMACEANGKKVLIITGVQYGNIRIMVQPKRGCYGPKCTGEVCRILHDPHLAPPHHWLATYKYIQDNSDVVVHFGTEGALEFLPGKQMGLGGACFPEISIGDLPNLYVYVMDATGDGLMAKRRGQAVLVDHLTPVFRPAPLDNETRHLEEMLDQYDRAQTMGETGRLDIICREMAPLMKACGMTDTEPGRDELLKLVKTARRQMDRMRHSLMAEGLHLLSAPPNAAGKAQMLAAILQTPPPGLPDPGTIAQWSDTSEGPVYDRAVLVLERLVSGRPVELLMEGIRPLAEFVSRFSERLDRCSGEIHDLLRGLDGRFICPGLSGSVSRGKIEALPTGRNFFATDVTTLPTKAAWEIGRQMADKLLLKYLDDENRFPESVGVSLWSLDAFKSDGELLCQILALMGAVPVWDRGKVEKTVPMDLDKLALILPDGGRLSRPRVDVTVQTSSIARDLVPHFSEIIDRTVILLSGLDEPDDRNFIRKHTREQMQKLRESTGERVSEAKIRRLSTLRVFSSAPGTYGLGVGLALDASAWQDEKDLAEVYINWGGHAYAHDAQNAADHGVEARQLLADQLARVDVAYMKQDSRQHDILECSGFAVFQGGMASAVSAMGKKPPRLYWGDSTRPAEMDVVDTAHEIQRSARTQLLNSQWIAHMRRHGYQGAHLVSGRVNNLFKWSATSRQVPKGLFDRVVKTYILDEENHEWLRQSNPYALEEITRRLMEAASRGLWEADEELLDKVRTAALEIEGDMEETMGDVEGEFMGSKVEVLTSRDVEKWDFGWKIDGEKKNAPIHDARRANQYIE